MKQLGGELGVKPTELKSLFTDSGRSSLRLFLNNNPGKKILLPDYLCEVILDVFDQEGVAFEFYRIDENFNIDIQSVVSKTFDVFYLINYFGKFHDELKLIDLDNCILLEDNVFNFKIENIYLSKKWYSFNSFRKISDLADGSQIKTNLPIIGEINNKTALFSLLKYQAKEMKYSFLVNKTDIEKKYLSSLSNAEEVLNSQREIHRMSDRSYEMLLNFYAKFEEENRQRIENYNVLVKGLKDYEISFERKEYSFFVMKIDNRDELRAYLFDHRIFLPIHWPFFGIENSIYNNVISVPLFSNYSTDDMSNVVERMKEFFGREKHI